MKYIKLSTPYFCYGGVYHICFFKLFKFNQEGYDACVGLVKYLCLNNFHFRFNDKKYESFGAIANSTLYPSEELNFENFSKVKRIDFHAGGDPYITMELIEKD